MNLFKSLNAFLLCSAVAAAWSPAHAEGDTNSTISLDTITVTTTKTEDPLIDTLAGASVVTDTEVTRFQPDRLSDILEVERPTLGRLPQPSPPPHPTSPRRPRLRPAGGRAPD